MKSSVCLALVHNNNEARNSYIRPQINNLLHQLEHTYDVRKIEVSFQNRIEPHSDLMAFFRDLMYFKLGCKWRHYRLVRGGAVHYIRFSQTFKKLSAKIHFISPYSWETMEKK